MDFEKEAREMAFPTMIKIVNEWHRQVGIGFIIRSKLRNAIADTVATKVFEQSFAEALRNAFLAGELSGREKAAEADADVVYTIRFRRGSAEGLWFVTSEDEPHLFIAHADLSAIIADIPNILTRAFVAKTSDVGMK
jgi:hypothetical protein